VPIGGTISGYPDSMLVPILAAFATIATLVAATLVQRELE